MKDQGANYILQRSVPFKILNSIVKGVNSIGIRWPAIEEDKLIRKARAVTGLDVLDERYLEGLRRLVYSINKEARINGFGRVAGYNQVLRSLIGRMQIDHHCRQHPWILQQAVERPAVIAGLPRSGTTILHALLSQDPATRSPLCWECLLPHPPPDPASFHDNDRIRAIEKDFGQLFKLVPNFQKMHLMSATTPQECLGIHALHFVSYQYATTFRLPSYLEWMSNTDLTELYRFHKKMLQFLQSGGVKGERWLLKSPVHLNSLHELFTVYPDACVITTHRHPVKVIPSVASLLSSVRSIYTDHEDPHKTGMESLETWSSYFEKYARYRELFPERDKQFFEIDHDKFIEKPLECVRRLYDHFEWELSREAYQRMEAFMKEHPYRKHGKHEYSPEQFGLTEEMIVDKFNVYIDYLQNKKKTPCTA